MAEWVGRQLGNYRLHRLLGRGGFAKVYLGEHVYLRTFAAVKILHMRLADDEMETFLNEARIIAHLEHPHIVRVLDFGVEENIPFLVMSYAPNGNLRQRYPKETLLPSTSIVNHVKQIAAALQYAHEQKLIHRDVKPENMLVGSHNTLLLSDFGLAIVAQSSFHQNLEKVVGTLAYIAPEQLQGKPCFASDQYALGVVVYEWLCGVPPFSGSPSALAVQHLHADPPSPHEKNPSVLYKVEQVVLKALVKDPQQRFATIQDFAHALEEACQAWDEAAQLQTLSTHVAFSEAQIAKMVVVAPISSSVLWNVPYRRNPFFTGREELLTHLHDVLTTNKAAVVTQAQAISGLGGIGKTQSALEYAYRYRHEYQVVLWIKADNCETIISDIIASAALLNLPEKDDQYQQRIVAAVKQWLEAQTRWLLIFDNVEDLTMISDLLPSTSKGSCHILLTTRMQVTGTLARRIDLEKMEPGEGALFLLRRAKVIASDAHLEDASETDRCLAEEISLAVDGLPLALDQAGAYIEQTACSLPTYLSHFQARQALLLAIRGELVSDHPESVTGTFSLSFEKVERANLVAAQLLRFCAFLYPDAIPEEVIIRGAAHSESDILPALDDPLVLDAAISDLRRFSLVRRNPDTKSLSVHRLVQAVLIDQMDEQERRQWAECAVQAIGLTLVTIEDLKTWPHSRESILQAHTCVHLIDRWDIVSSEARQLLDQTGTYLREYAQYVQAEQYYRQALSICERTVGPDHSTMASILTNMATLYRDQGKYAQAESLYQQALVIYERTLEAEHLDLAVCLNLLGELYFYQGKYAQTIPLFQRTQAIREPLLGPEHPLVVECLNNLGATYKYLGTYVQAESFFQRALAITEKTGRMTHPDTSIDLMNLAKVCCSLGKYRQSEALFQQAQALCEQTLGPEHPLMGHIFGQWAVLHLTLGKYSQAECCYQRAIDIREKILGPEHPDRAQSINGLAKVRYLRGEYACAETLFLQALTIREKALGLLHPDVAESLNDLAKLYYTQRKYTQAENLYQQAVTVCEQNVGLQHPRVAQLFNDLAMLYTVQAKYAQAESYFRKSLDMRVELLGSEHCEVAQSINCWAKLRYSRGEYTDAEPLFQQALAVREKVLDTEHPDVAETLNDLARLYYAQKKYMQAEPLYQRALAIREQILGPEHPDTGEVLKNYALLLLVTKRNSEAAKMATRVKAIRARYAHLASPPPFSPVSLS